MTGEPLSPPGGRLGPEAFARVDDAADGWFYAQPRLVHHIDDDAVAALTGFYRRTLRPGGALLDLMSSWVSHLPEDVAYGPVTGLGLNDEELAANPRLARRVVQDLNLDPSLPFDDGEFDACLIAVSVQHLTRPVEVLAEAARVLRPGAPCIVSFSNRMFPTKAVAVWRATGDRDHARLVAHYLDAAGGFGPASLEALRPVTGIGDPLFAVTAQRSGAVGDPASE